MKEKTHEPPDQGEAVALEPASDEDLFWIQLLRTSINDQRKEIEDTAKQVIAIAGILAGLYINGLSLTELANQQLGAKMIVYLLPLLALAVSLLLAVFVLARKPRRVASDTPPAIKAWYTTLVAAKYRYLQASLLCLALGLGLIVAAVAAYLWPRP